MDKFIYLDNHATTKIDERVLELMMPFLKDNYGNPSNRDSRFGRIAFEAVEIARQKVAKLINAQIEEIIFTSCATESNNLVLKGFAENNFKKGKHIVTVATEHSSILEVCKKLESFGFEITILNVDKFGRISIEELVSSLRKDTILVSVMMANNEIGTIHPIKKIAKICRDKNIAFHTDASQCGAYLEIDSKIIDATFITLSSHKMFGPKGVGALFVNKNHSPKINSQIDGGGQENKMRSGTLNVPAIVGFGKACEIAMNEQQSDFERISNLRNQMQNELLKLGEITINGEIENRLPNNLNISIEGIQNTTLLKNVKNLVFSTNSACLSTDISMGKFSHILRAIGLNETEAKSTIRFGLGRFTTKEEIFEAIEILKTEINNIRKNNLVIN